MESMIFLSVCLICLTWIVTATMKLSVSKKQNQQKEQYLLALLESLNDILNKIHPGADNK